jgi:hypothetical protein
MQVADAKMQDARKNNVPPQKISRVIPNNLAPTHNIRKTSADLYHKSWASAAEGPQKKSMSQSPMVQPSSSTASYHNTCYLPPEVKLVCDHFMTDYKNRRIGIDQKRNVCKMCRNKCFARYAFWSQGFKRWYLIRSYPIKVNRVAFQPCKHFNDAVPCVTSTCTFAHGPELIMWTMEREGSK